MARTAKKGKQSAPTRDAEVHALPGAVDLWEAPPSWHAARREAFIAYRDMRDRSIEAVARQLRKSGSLLRRWSVEDGWGQRIEAWEREQARQRSEAFRESNIRYGEEVAAEIAEMREALLQPGRAALDLIAERIKAGKDPWEGIGLAERIRLTGTAARAFAQIATADRLARGLSTDNVAGHDGGPLPDSIERKSLDEVEAWLAGKRDAPA